VFSSLDRLDMRIASAEGIRCVQTDHRPAAEIQQQEELSTLFALTRVLGPLTARATDEVVYVCAEPPPEFLRRVVASAGGMLQVQKGPVLPYEGPPGKPEDLADNAFRRLADRVLRERGATLDESTLEALQRELTPTPDREKEEPVYWARVAEFAAVAGELLRAKLGGRWVVAPKISTIPFAFRLGAEDSSRYILSNVAGRAERFLENGARDNPGELLSATGDREIKPPEPGPVLPILKAVEWPGRDTMACRPLVSWQDPRAAMPWITYGEEPPSSSGPISKDSPQAKEPDVLHAQALENLKALSARVIELTQKTQKILTVIGPPYAAEKVLDAGFLQGLHKRLGSPSLVAGIPRKGLLMVMNARVQPTYLTLFLELCEKNYSHGEFEPISPLPLLIEDGTISGFMWVPPDGAPRLVRAAELGTSPLRGFFRRLFGGKRG
jgi:hypothetical protein